MLDILLNVSFVVIMDRVAHIVTSDDSTKPRAVYSIDQILGNNSQQHNHSHSPPGQSVFIHLFLCDSVFF